METEFEVEWHKNKDKELTQFFWNKREIKDRVYGKWQKFDSSCKISKMRNEQIKTASNNKIVMDRISVNLLIFV